jgi:hypothetical protein
MQKRYLGIRNKGQLWTETIEGIFTLGLAGMMYILFNQIYTNTLRGIAIRTGVHAGNLGMIDMAWNVVLIPVALAFSFAIISVARKKEGLT